MCFITLFVKKGETPSDVQRYTQIMKDVASKNCNSFGFKASKKGKRLTLTDLCEVKKTHNPTETLNKMIAEINEKTNGTAGGWVCKKP